MQKSNNTVEEVLATYSDALGDDLPTYRNHIYRVFNLAILFDPAPENKYKYAVAAVFHDIGIWTHGTFDYLGPSIYLAEKYLKEKNEAHLFPEIKEMIGMHHKITKYSGKYNITVEAFRKADWIDVTLGIKKFGADKSFFKKIKREFPNLGFHKFLAVQVLKRFCQSPLDPLPMFKK
ncbi:MAG TPA: phosphohydrolase [Bacteroidetes bacterium]|nr:phosphohydrolase [Bacteroidota bacterium]